MKTDWCPQWAWDEAERITLGFSFDAVARSIFQERIARALLDAHQRGRLEGLEWKPIETAPRDGTRVLLLLSNGEVFSGWGTGANGFYRYHSDGSDIGWLNAKYWMPIPDLLIRAKMEEQP